MKRWWERTSARPVVAHLLRALTRFGERLGSQFAAAIAYFSVVALVPVLMVGFSSLGLALTVFYPNALASIEDQARSMLGDGAAGQAIMPVITSALNSWAGIGGVGLITALWIGSAWIGTLKRAIRVQLRPQLGVPEPRLPFVLDVAQNLGIFLVVLAGVLVTFAAVPFATMLSSEAIAGAGLPDWLGSGLLKVLSLVLSLLVGMALFWLTYRFCAVDPLAPRALLAGSLLGSVGLTVLQLATTYLLAAFSRNAAFAVFGTGAVLMLFFNVFANLMLLVAAWTSTWDASVPFVADDDVLDGTAAAEGRAALSPASASPDAVERAMKTGLGAGYVVGVGSGLGIGALAVSLLRRRRPGRSGR